MQRSLIDHRTGDQRFVVFFQSDGHSIKPIRPLFAQMTLDPYLTDGWLVWITDWNAFFVHNPLLDLVDVTIVPRAVLSREYMYWFFVGSGSDWFGDEYRFAKALGN
jgi:hypothetical protein